MIQKWNGIKKVYDVKAKIVGLLDFLVIPLISASYHYLRKKWYPTDGYLLILIVLFNNITSLEYKSSILSLS